MKNSREGLALMALGAVVFLLSGLLTDGTPVRWIGGAVAAIGFVTWQWHARKGLRERQED